MIGVDQLRTILCLAREKLMASSADAQTTTTTAGLLALDSLVGLLPAVVNGTCGLADPATAAQVNAVLEYLNKHSEDISTLGYTMLAGGILGALAPFGLGLLGFSAAGPVAGSIAATWQATYGGVIASGSAFSLCQGFAMGTSALVVQSAGVISAGAGAAVAWLSRPDAE